jgi:glycosyltransferase involved in cell wall biosynthesis
MKRRNSVLHVVPWPVFGGPHNEAVVYGSEARRRGWTVRVLLPPQAPDSTRFTESGIGVSRLAQHRLRRTRSPRFWLTFPALFVIDVFRLSLLMRRLRPAIVEGSSVNLQPAIAARFTGAKVVWRLADVLAPAAVRHMIGIILPRLAHVILVNGVATIRAYPGLADRPALRVYYPAPDPTLFHGDRPGGPPGGVTTVGTVANLNPDKGLEVLVEAACLLRRDLSIAYVVVGSEHETHREYAHGLRRQVAECGLETRFTFAGHQADVAGTVAAMDIFVISSHREGTTTTVLEAMALGLPVIATDVGGIAEIVIHGKTGLLVPRGDPRAMAAAIAQLAGDPAARRRLGTAGRNRYKAEFSPSTAFEDRFAAYAAALSS